jgi:hypothetical protein
VLLYYEFVPLISPHLYGRAYVVFHPLNEPIYVLHVSSKTDDFYKWQLGVRLAYIQVGGIADGAAGAEAKRTHERINRTKPIESAAARSRPR